MSGTLLPFTFKNRLGRWLVTKYSFNAIKFGDKILFQYCYEQIICVIYRPEKLSDVELDSSYTRKPVVSKLVP